MDLEEGSEDDLPLSVRKKSKKKKPKNFTEKKRIRKYKKRVTPKEKKYVCDDCGKKFYWPCTLNKHRLVHTDLRPYSCDVCGKAFNSNYTLKGHKLIHTNEKPYKCSFCSYACRDSSTLRKHQYRHMGIVQRYECAMCAKSFSKKHSLKEHVAEVHFSVDLKKYPCERCGKTFKTPKAVDIHNKTVHDRTYKTTCPICNLAISNKYNLKMHLVSHTEHRPYVCNFTDCGKRYKDVYSLNKHSRKHNPDKQFPCPECGYMFTRKFRMQTHVVKVHQRARRVQCHHCGQRFYSKNYLIVHIRKKHNPKRKKYICDMCGLKTYNKPSIVMHIKHGHGNENDRECHICHTIYRRNVYLKMHYKKTHGIIYKRVHKFKKVAVTLDKIKIKTEPSDDERSIDLFEIDKQEPIEEEQLNDQANHEDEGSRSDQVRDMIERCGLKNVPEKVFNDFCRGRVILTPYEEKIGKVKPPPKILQDIGTIDLKAKRAADKSAAKLMFEVRRKTTAEKLERARQMYNERMTNICSRVLKNKTSKIKSLDPKDEKLKDAKNENEKYVPIEEDKNSAYNKPSTPDNENNAVNEVHDKENGIEPDDYNDRETDTSSKNKKPSIDSDEDIATKDGNDTFDEHEQSSDDETTLQTYKTKNNNQNSIEINSKSNISCENGSPCQRNEQASQNDIVEKQPNAIIEEVMAQNESTDITNKPNILIENMDSQNNNVLNDTSNNYTNIDFSLKDPTVHHLSLLLKDVDNDITKCDDVHKETLNNINLMHDYALNPNETEEEIKEENDRIEEERLKEDSESLETVSRRKQKLECRDEFVTIEVPKTENFAVTKKIKRMKKVAKSNKPVITLKDTKIMFKYIKKDRIRKQKLEVREFNESDDDLPLVFHKNFNNKDEKSEDNVIVESSDNNEIPKIEGNNSEKDKDDGILIEIIAKEILNSVKDLGVVKDKEETTLQNKISEEKTDIKDKDSNTLDSEVRTKRKRKLNRKYIDTDNFVVGDKIYKSVDEVPLSIRKKINKRKDVSQKVSKNFGTKNKIIKKYSTDSKANKTKPGKMNFNSHQCYVCFKLFETKEKLVEHCQEHFDVCTEKVLMKCPLCDYVGRTGFSRHVRLVHNIKFKIPYSKLRDKKDNSDGSRYYFEIDDPVIKTMEVIPSVNNLNKIAMIKIDKQKREVENKTIAKPKLVKKGKEWIVEKEKIDFDKGVMIPKINSETVKKISEKNIKVSDPDPYLDSLKKLYHVAKKEGKKIMFPCQHCDKICQNFAALKLHTRKHEINPKPFAPKVWKHKLKDPALYPPKPEKVSIKVNHRTAKPQPIKNNHKCDPELKEFYEQNIRGGDIEFWQFLKIFNKMSRDHINDFEDLDGNYDYGIDHHVNIEESKVENVNIEETKNSIDDENDTNPKFSETIPSSINKTHSRTNRIKTKVNNNKKTEEKVRKQSGKEFYLKRKLEIAKLRQKLGHGVQKPEV